jgi:hypothetical protein
MNGLYNFGSIEVKITQQKRERMLGIVEYNELIKFEIILNGITQYMNLHQFLTIRTFEKFILRRLSISNHCLVFDIEN